MLARSVVPAEVIFAYGELRKLLGNLAEGSLVLDFEAKIERNRTICQASAPSG